MSTVDTLEDAVRKFIVDELLQGQGEELTNSTQLVEAGIVDSINVLKLVDFVEEGYEIELEPNDIRKFTSVTNIVEVVQNKLAG